MPLSQLRMSLIWYVSKTFLIFQNDFLFASDQKTPISGILIN